MFLLWAWARGDKKPYSPGSHGAGVIFYCDWLSRNEDFFPLSEATVEFTVITLADCPLHSWTAHQKNTWDKAMTYFIKFSLVLFFNFERIFFFFLREKGRTHPTSTTIQVPIASEVFRATWVTFALESVQKSIIHPWKQWKMRIKCKACCRAARVLRTQRAVCLTMGVASSLRLSRIYQHFSH